MYSEVESVYAKTKHGEICGKKVYGVNDIPYVSFQGIPYARPPINELRFKAPVEPEPWHGIRDATKEGNRCSSFNRNGEISGVEDCLYLNVYTPQMPDGDSQLKPVMFWIHGGGFYMGSGSADFYSPDYLIAEDVILVTFNYRLGIFGWIKFDDPALEAPGNAGGKDIILALKWVQENIVQFNGDPNNVTVFGQSAGGICAHLLIISPLATGLFHKVICQAGTSFVGFDKRTRLFKSGFKYAEFLGFHSSNEKEVFDFLSTQPAENLVKAMMVGKKWMYQTDTKYALRIKRAIKFHQANEAGPVYLYRFSFDSPNNLYKKMFDWKSNGATHADELYYLFHTKYSKPFVPDSFDDKTRYRMVKFWTNFAKNGDPNPDVLDSIIDVKWRPVEWGKLNHLNIGKYLKACDTQPDDKRMKLWDDIYKTYYEDRIAKIQRNLGRADLDESKKEENASRIEPLKFSGAIR